MSFPLPIFFHKSSTAKFGSECSVPWPAPFQDIIPLPILGSGTKSDGCALESLPPCKEGVSAVRNVVSDPNILCCSLALFCPSGWNSKGPLSKIWICTTLLGQLQSKEAVSIHRQYHFILQCCELWHQFLTMDCLLSGGITVKSKQFNTVEIQLQLHQQTCHSKDLITCWTICGFVQKKEEGAKSAVVKGIATTKIQTWNQILPAFYSLLLVAHLKNNRDWRFLVTENSQKKQISEFSFWLAWQRWESMDWALVPENSKKKWLKKPSPPGSFGFADKGGNLWILRPN